VEVCPFPAVDELLRGWRHHSTSVQPLSQREDVEEDSGAKATLTNQELHGKMNCKKFDAIGLSVLECF